MQLAILLGVMGPWQIVLIVVVLLLLFGGKKIPELMRGLGTGMKEFKDATKEENEPPAQNSDRPHSNAERPHSNTDPVRPAESHSTHEEKK